MPLPILFALFVFISSGLNAMKPQESDQLGFYGVQISGYDPENTHTLPGPLPGMTGFRTTASGRQWNLDPIQPTGSVGSLSLWLLNDQTHQGHVLPRNYSPFVARVVDGPLKLILFAQSNQFQYDGVFGGLQVRSQIPSLPGPAWVHFAMEWDGVRGVANVYLNGTSIDRTDLPRNPWNMPEIKGLKLDPSRFAVSGLRLSDQLLNMDDVRRELTAAYWGSLRFVGGSEEDAPYIISAFKGDLLYENSLGHPDDLAGLKLEGPILINQTDGWLEMSSSQAGIQDSSGTMGHVVAWLPFQSPDDYIAEWEFQIQEKHLCILFFSANGTEGRSLFDPSLSPRDGTFEGYIRGDVETYHISYYAGGRLTANLRKNPGFFLLANGPQPREFELNRPYLVQLLKRKGHIQLAIDGVVSIDFFDDGKTYGKTLAGGYFGLRQMRNTFGRYRNFKVYSVK